MGIDPITATIQVVLAVASASYGRRKRKKQERKLRERAAARLLNVRPTGSGEAIPIVYGYTPVEPIQVYVQTSDSYGISGPTDRGDFGTMFAPRQGDANQFLMIQSVLSVGELSSVQQVWLDQRNVDTTDLTSDVRAHWSYNQASVFATSFNATERPESARFTGLSYLTAVMDVNPDDPKFSGIPSVLCFCRGVKTYDITQSGRASEKTDSMGAVRVLLDYLISPDYGPPGITEADIDWPSWKAANDIATSIVQGEEEPNDNDLWTTPYPEDLNRRDGTAYDRWSDAYGDADFDDRADSGATESTNWGTHSEALCRYDFNGLVYPSDEYPSVVESILAVMPGSVLYRSLEGKLKLSLPDSIRTAQAQSVGTIDGDILKEPVKVEYPDADTKLNRASARFINKHKEMAQDELTFPTADSAFDLQLRRRDNEIMLHETRTLDGVTDKYHAISILANDLLTSGRPRFVFRTGPDGAIYEPGEVVGIVDESVGIPLTYVRILDVKLRPDLDVMFDAIEFLPTDYAWNISDKEELSVQPRRSREVNRPAQIVAEFQEEGRVMVVTWTPASTIGIETIEYEVQFRRFGAAWTVLANVHADSPLTAVHVPEFRQSTYRYRVRAVSFTGQLSPWRESVDYEADGRISTADTRALTAGADRPADPAEGDLHIDADGTVQRWDGTQWVSTGVDLTGPESASVILVGPGQILNELPTVEGNVVGDVAVATTGEVWTWDGTDWNLEGNLRGLDGIGYEFIYAATTGERPSLPDNTWGYEQPVRPWFDDAPSLTEENNTLWQSRRVVQGTPMVGADVSGGWGDPRIVGHYGRDGGVTWHSGESDPVTLLGNDGDLYIQYSQTSIRGLWRRHNGEWIFLSGHPDLETWFGGTGDPSASLGSVGDWYFNNGTSGIWIKTASVGWLFLVLVSGPGKTWHSGQNAPLNSLGNNGDCYFQFENGFSYRKTSGAWVFDRDVTGVAAGSMAPGTPSLPTLLSVTQSSISISTAPNPQGGQPSSYEWRYGLTENNPTVALPAVQSANTLITGLVVNTDYYLSVRAINDAGGSDWSGELRVRTTAVVAAQYNNVGQTSVSNLQPTSATVSWIAPLGGSHDANNNLVTVQSYLGNIRVAGNAWPDVEDTVNAEQTSFALTGLTPGTRYDYRIRVRYSDGGLSNYITGEFTTGEQAGPVPGVYNPVRSFISSFVASFISGIAWARPLIGSHDTSNNPVFVSAYLVSFREGNGQYGDETSFSSTTFEGVLTGLSAETTYTARIRVRYSDDGLSDYMEATFTTLIAQPIPPTYNPIRDLALTSVAANSALTLWRAPASGSHDRNNLPVTVSEYRVSTRAGRGDYGAEITLLGEDSVGLELTPLTPSTEYTVRVRVLYSDGGFSDYVSRTFTTLVLVVPAVYNPPRNLIVSNIQSTTAQANWNAPFGGSHDDANVPVSVVRYEGSIRIPSQNWPSDVASVAAPTTSFGLTGLTPSTFYQYRIRAIYSNGGRSLYLIGSFSTIAASVVTPRYNPPRNVRFSDITVSTALATWNAPLAGSHDQFNAPVTLTGYAGSIRRQREMWPTDEVTVGASVTSFQLTGLTRGIVYDYRLRATYSNGGVSGYLTGTFQTELILDLGRAIYNPIQNPGVSEVSGNRATATWDAPATGSQDAIGNPLNPSSYLFSFQSVQGNAWSDELIIDAGTRSRVIEGLELESDYRFRVRVVYSDGGLSGYVTFDFSTTDGVDSLYNRVSDLSISAVLLNSATVTWAAPEQGSHDSNNQPVDVAAYLFSMSESEGNYQAEVVLSETTLSRDLSELMESTRYGVRVRVRYSDGGHSGYLSTGFTTQTTPVYNVPTSVSAINVTDRAATATWGVPMPGSHDADLNDIEPSRYHVSWRQQGTQDWTDDVFTGGFEWNIDRLVAETTYEVRVRAEFPDGGFSEYASGQFVTDIASTAMYNPVTGLTSGGTSQTGIYLNWNAPQGGSHGPEPDETPVSVSAILLSFRTPQTAFSDELVLNATATANQYAGLTPGTMYTFRVRVRYSDGGLSDYVVYEGTTLFMRTRNRPTDIQVVIDGDGLLATWVAPADSVEPDGTPVMPTGYNIRFISKPHSIGEADVDLPPTATSQTHHIYWPGVVYDAHLNTRYYDTELIGDFGTILTPHHPGAMPISNLRVGFSDRDIVRLEWDRPQSGSVDPDGNRLPFAQFCAQGRVVGETLWNVAFEESLTNPRYNIPVGGSTQDMYLQRGTEYEFRVWALYGNLVNGRIDNEQGVYGSEPVSIRFTA